MEIIFTTTKGDKLIVDNDHYFRVISSTQKEVLVCYHSNVEYWKYKYVSIKQFNSFRDKLAFLFCFNGEHFYKLI